MPTNGAAPTSGTSAAEQGLPQADLERRADHLYERFEDDGFLGWSSDTPYKEIAGDLKDLSAQDAARLQSIYNEKYSAKRGDHDLLADINREVMSPADRYQAYQQVAPDRVQRQWTLAPSDRREWSLDAERPLDVQVPGAKAVYQAASPDLIYAPDNGPQVRAFVNIPAQGDKPARTQQLYRNDTGGFEFDVPNVDRYEVVFEVKYKNGPAEYHSYTQIVRPAATVAEQTLDRVQVTSPAAELYTQQIDAQIDQTKAALAEAEKAWPGGGKEGEALRKSLDALNQARDEVPKALGDQAVPIQAVLVAKETGQPIPLQLYAKPLGDGKWSIVDITDPTKPRHFDGKGATAEEGIRDAWKNFVDGTDLPAGEIAARAPQIPLGYTGKDAAGSLNFGNDQVWHGKNDGKTSFSDWVSGLSWGSVGLFAAGAVTAFVPGVEWATPFLWGAAGVAGAGAGALNIADRAKIGTFEPWSLETAIDVLSIVGGVTAGAASAGSVARAAAVNKVLAGTATTAEASLASGEVVNIARLGNFVSITSKAATTSGVGGGVLVGAEYMKAIHDVANSNLPPSEKQRKTQEILRQAALTGSIAVIGHGLGKLNAHADLLSARMGAAKVDPHLQQAVRASPALQEYFARLGPERLRSLADVHARNPGTMTLSELAEATLAGRVPAAGNRVDLADNIFRGSYPTDASVPAKYTSDPRFASLAADPDHAGAVSPKTRVEAMTILEAEAQGLIQGPVKRGPKGIEAYDASGHPWDVKTPPSPPPGSRRTFNVEQVGNSIKSELTAKTDTLPDGSTSPPGTFRNDQTGQADARRVILNSTYMTSGDHKALWTWLEQNLTPQQLTRIVEVNVATK